MNISQKNNNDTVIKYVFLPTPILKHGTFNIVV